MIHVATVHYHEPCWIPIQHRYLRRHIERPYRTYASLEGLDPSYGSWFDVAVPGRGPHAGKLNHLAMVISEHADPNDWILFLDGDAFPIADPIDPVERLLGDHSLAAVCRPENAGDLQPHPCFCVVPVGRWFDLPGDWGQGHCFREHRSDVGANLLFRLEQTGTRWAPIYRSNTFDLHPVLFGVYGGFIYHHGGGFRGKVVTLGDPDQAAATTRQERVADVMIRADRNCQLSQEVLADIQADEHFYRRFYSPANPH